MSERDGRTARAGGEVSWSAVASSTQPSSRASSIVNPSAILYAREDTRDATYISWLSSLSTTTITRARSPSREFALVRSNELKTPPLLATAGRRGRRRRVRPALLPRRPSMPSRSWKTCSMGRRLSVNDGVGILVGVNDGSLGWTGDRSTPPGLSCPAPLFPPHDDHPVSAGQLPLAHPGERPPPPNTQHPTPTRVISPSASLPRVADPVPAPPPLTYPTPPHTSQPARPPVHIK